MVAFGGDEVTEKEYLFRVGLVHVDKETFDWLAESAAKERRSVADEAAIRLQKMHRPVFTLTPQTGGIWGGLDCGNVKPLGAERR